MRRARSSISRVGPPPPSPWPNGISDQSLQPCRRSSPMRAPARRDDLGVVGVDRREVGEHPGAVEALPPERVVREAVLLVPRQLLGDEAVMPPAAKSWGSPPGSRTRRGSTPRCSARRSASRSSAGRARSGGRGSRPTAGSCRPRPTCPRPGRTGPPATFTAMRSNSSGWRSSIHCVLLGLRAREPVLGVLVHEPTADANVRVHLRTVSRIGHSQAVSMWAWPVATTRCALGGRQLRAPGPGRSASRRRRGTGRGTRLEVSAAGPVAGSSTGRVASPRRARRGRARAPRPRCRQRRGRRVAGTGRAAVPAVSGSPSGDGTNWWNVGFDAASTRIVTGPGRLDAVVGAAGWMPWTGRPSSSTTSPSHWNPARRGGSRDRSPLRPGARPSGPARHRGR
jgi:hypothetical protein